MSSLNALPVHIEPSVYFSSFIKSLLVFHVPVTKLNTFKCSSNHSAYKVLQVFLLLVYVTRNTADITTLYINSLAPFFAKSVL